MSALSVTDQTAYQLSGGNFSVYGFEYQPGIDNAVRFPSRNLHSACISPSLEQYITWISNNQSAWTLLSSGMGPDTKVEISNRLIPTEPMARTLDSVSHLYLIQYPQYLIANLGISPAFGRIDFEHLQFPATMRIDYIRVYQQKDQINIGCDPPNFPTMSYINQSVWPYSLSR